MSSSTLTLALALVCAGSALAQEAAVAPSEPAPRVVVQPQADGPVESVIVTGQRSLPSLLSEAARETENFYARLNDVLQNPDFKITCRNEYPTGSNLSQRVCRMRYQEELDSRAALSAIQGVETIRDIDTGEATGSVFRGTPYDILPQAKAMMQQFEVEVVQAVNADPTLNASVAKLMQLKAAVDSYESSRQENRRESQAADEISN